METRLYKAGAVQSIPSMASLVSAGYPTGGDPVLGIAATKPGDAWYYGIGEEIRNVILAAGLTPSNNVLNQLAQAIEILAEKHGFSTGDVKPLISNTIQDGWLLGNSAVVSRSANSKLTQYAYDNGFVRSAAEQAEYEANPATFSGPIYGPGDGSTTIQLPDFRGRSLMGAMSAARVGRYQPEQLPNVTGQFVADNRREDGEIQTQGVFKLTDSSEFDINTNLTARSEIQFISFKSSLSNAVYTDNGRVYPLSITSNYIVKA